MYLGQVSRCHISFAVNQLTRAMSKPSKAHIGSAKYLRSYVAGSVNFSIFYKRGGFKLAAYSDTNWGNNPESGKSTSSYIVMLTNDPISFKMGLQNLKIAMEVELVEAALSMKEAIYCSNIMVGLDFKKGFSSVLLYLGKHVAGNRTYSPRVKHIALKYFSFKS